MFKIEKSREQACFTEAVSFCFGSAGAFTACQVNQTELAHIHLVFVLFIQNTLSKIMLQKLHSL